MRKTLRGIALLLALGAIWARPALAQPSEPEAAPAAAEAWPVDETEETPVPTQTTSESPGSGDVLAGPRSVTQALIPGDGLTSPQFRSPGLRDTFPQWFALKDRLKKEDHLDLGAD